ncbi:MAG: hypothetical protein K2N48_11550 [Muribaculaceae bacterium]|nr:hypothetical protein [Muribaculaceae bacterium]
MTGSRTDILNYRNDDTPRMIINPVGGLANRMRAMASGIALADAIGCDFRIVWRCNSELNASVEEIFNVPDYIKSKIIYPLKLEYSLKYSAPRKRNLYVSGLIAPIFFGHIFRDWTPEFRAMVVNNKNESLKETAEKYILSGRNVLFQSGLSFYPFPIELYRNIFRASNAVETKSNAILNSLGDHSIGFHIRRSDNSESIKHSPDSLFISEMDAAIHDNPKVKFYLATDDETTKVDFARKYGDRIISSKSVASRATKEGIIDAATEMYILSKTDRIVGSFYSSFSEAAAMLGDRNLKQVYRN